MTEKSKKWEHSLPSHGEAKRAIRKSCQIPFLKMNNVLPRADRGGGGLQEGAKLHQTNAETVKST